MVTKWSDFSRNIHTTTTFFGWGDWFLETNYRSSFLQVALAFQLIISWWCFTPLKINMEPKITQLKRKIIFQISILGFHVDFRGCIPPPFPLVFPHPFATSWWFTSGGWEHCAFKSRGEKAFVKFWSKEGYPKKRVKAVGATFEGWSPVGRWLLIRFDLEPMYLYIYIYIDISMGFVGA